MADPDDELLLPLIGVNQNPDEHGDNDDSDRENGMNLADSDSENAGNEEENEEMQENAEPGEVNAQVLNGAGDREEGEEDQPGGRWSIKGIFRSLSKKSDKSQEKVKINFDQSLPSTHSYLGDDLEEVRGRTIFEENSEIILPLLLLPNVVLVPGQVIPLQVYRERLVAMIRRVADNDKTFGVITISRGHEYGNQEFSDVGCTAEIYSMKQEMHEPSGLSNVIVKARGRQRFRMIEMKSEITGEVVGKIKILPEISLNHALQNTRLPSHRKLMVAPVNDSEDMVKTAVDRQGRILTSVDLRQSRRPLTKLYSAHNTWWPPWVFKLYDIDWLTEQIKAELHSWCPSSLPPDPIDLSFWVAHNLPVNNDVRLRLLKFDSVVQRLRFGLSVIRKSGKLLCCESCQEEIASKESVFSMSREGPLGAYVNPGGYVHEMFTVSKVQNLYNVGGSSIEHSWFPGYAWTIVQCRGCHSHMGWMFTAAKRNLSPKKFWGLCRSSIKTTFGTVSNDEGEETEGYIM
uniref:Protein cereblon n=1 Tax=Biomphalaria glabrata TaxID=6526 RepID=A0A2C9KJ22_BIOGL